jgi:hypothetical protein
MSLKPKDPWCVSSGIIKDLSISIFKIEYLVAYILKSWGVGLKIFANLKVHFIRKLSSEF